MYGVVLMMSMAGGVETPAMFNHGCQGCTGCSGTVTYSCSGYSCCGGCKGHKGHKSKSCHGCCGNSCHGYSCHGYSCHGNSCHGYSCHGYSCCGYATCCGTSTVSCYGSPVTHGVPATYGAPDMSHPGVSHPGVSHPGVISDPGMKVMPDTKTPDPKIDGKKIEKLKKPPVDNDMVEAAPARITITVPTDARVSIDGTMTVSNETTRTFESPTLLVGKSYSYTFQAEFVRDGKEVVVTRKVKVKAGSDVTVSLENSGVVASR